MEGEIGKMADELHEVDRDIEETKILELEMEEKEK